MELEETFRQKLLVYAEYRKLYFQNVDALCTLAINALYQKVFFFIYFWNCFLVLVTIGGLFFSLLTRFNWIQGLIFSHGTKLGFAKMT